MTETSDIALKSPRRDHGGGIDAACAKWGGERSDWIDLSTGINPVAYRLLDFPANDWTTLPDHAAFARLNAAARNFWDVPATLDLLPVPGASAAIARIPSLVDPGRVHIPAPTYNEHAASFAAAGWANDGGAAEATVLVNPNNPDGRFWKTSDLPGSGLLVLDESFCDIAPEQSLLPIVAERPDTLILKSFGKFWGLAGLRLGFAIGSPDLIEHLREMTGPWAVSGPALRIGALALSDDTWANETRKRLASDANRLDELMVRAGAAIVGGTSLFRLYEVGDARSWQERLAQRQIWTRRFPYSDSWLRLGLPGLEADWDRLASALA